VCVYVCVCVFSFVCVYMCVCGAVLRELVPLAKTEMLGRCVRVCVCVCVCLCVCVYVCLWCRTPQIGASHKD